MRRRRSTSARRRTRSSVMQLSRCPDWSAAEQCHAMKHTAWTYGGAAVGLALGLAACDDHDDGRGRGTDPPELLDPTTIPKYTQPLVAIPEMPPTAVTAERTDYRVAVRQFTQQILPPPLPASTVWGYGREGDPLPGDGVTSTFHVPGYTFETRSDRPVRVTWVNQLVDDRGAFLPHLFPVDATIHWADPEHAGHEHAGHEHADDEDASYRGPIPIVTHVHGAHSFDHSDGYPEAWYMPDAVDLPDEIARRGPFYRTQAEVERGAAVFDYPQDENGATLWYHDHTLGITRINIYAGLFGFWIIRDGVEDALALPGPAPRVDDPPGTRYYELPIVIADRNFTIDGQMSYPTTRSQFDGYDGPVVPASDVPPIWGPEFIGNTILVNGRTWPFLEIEPRLYRFRLLNASDARTLMMRFDRAGLPFIQIGSDGGLLPDRPVPQEQLVLGPAERVDVLVDFSGLAPGDTVLLLNRGPDEPWGGPDAGQDPADPETTGQIMQLRVVAPTGAGTPGTIPATLPAVPRRTTTLAPRDLVLAEADTPDNFPTHVNLGTVELGPLPWTAPTTEVVKLGDTEIWRLANLTDDVHPIHLHLIDFQILDRTPFDADAFAAAQAAWLDGSGPVRALDEFVTGPPVPATGGEIGEKDTVLAMPGMITRIIARFDRTGRYVWHCHITEHEDNEMMRPLEIVP